MNELTQINKNHNQNHNVNVNKNKKPRNGKSKLKAKRLRARMSHNSSNQSYLDHLRKTRNHNHNFKKMTQKIKQMARNVNCPALTPLLFEEKKLIINTIS